MYFTNLNEGFFWTQVKIRKIMSETVFTRTLCFRTAFDRKTFTFRVANRTNPEKIYFELYTLGPDLAGKKNANRLMYGLGLKKSGIFQFRVQLVQPGGQIQQTCATQCRFWRNVPISKFYIVTQNVTPYNVLFGIISVRHRNASLIIIFMQS